MNRDEYFAAYEGRIGADRMRLGLSIIPNKLYGDMDEVKRLRDILEKISKDPNEIILNPRLSAEAISAADFYFSTEAKHLTCEQAHEEVSKRFGRHVHDELKAYFQT